MSDHTEGDTAAALPLLRGDGSPGLSKVALAMIVKNESKVIARCIRSFSPIIDMVVLVDTGSDDDTLKVAAETCMSLDLPLVADSEEWVDFGKARTQALVLARESTDADVTLMMDADWTMTSDSKSFDADILRNLKPFGGVTAWNFTIKDQGLTWPLPRVTWNHHPWEYSAPVHEYLDDHGAGGVVGPTIQGIAAVHRSDGGSRVGRHHRDAEILKDLEDPRSKFYYAQSLFAIEQYEEALAAYRERASMREGWAEETYWSLYRAGQCAAALKRYDEAVGLFMYSWGTRPTRIEALCSCVELWRQREMWGLAFRFAAEAVEIARSGEGLKDSLFLEKWRWEWGAEWEYLVSGLVMGDTAKCVQGLRDLRKEHSLPQGYDDATGFNIEWGKKRLTTPAKPHEHSH